MQHALVWCLLVSLPLVGLSTTLTQLLGPRHFHTESVAAGTAFAPQRIVAWLRDVPLLAELRQMRQSALAQAHSGAHVHSHDHLSRHRHAADDDSVVVIDPSPAEDGEAGAPAEPAAPVWAFTAGLRAALLGGLRDAWPQHLASAFRSAAQAREERPPKG